MTRAYPVEWARHINVTKEPLLFYTNLVALHYMLTSSRLAMSTARPLTLPSDCGFYLLRCLTSAKSWRVTMNSRAIAIPYIIIIPISEEDGPVVTRYDPPLEKAFETTYKLSLSSALLDFFPVSSIASQPSPPHVHPLSSYVYFCITHRAAIYKASIV